MKVNLRMNLSHFFNKPYEEQVIQKLGEIHRDSIKYYLTLQYEDGTLKASDIKSFIEKYEKSLHFKTNIKVGNHLKHNDFVWFDIIDKNTKTCLDIGSGSGLPGVVLAIIFKKKGSKIKFELYEKSQKKSNFLRKMIKHFELNAEVKQKNIFEQKELEADIIVARAFKPLQTILELINKNFAQYNRLILFLGKSGRDNINECLKLWKFDYEIVKSLTDVNSVIVKINNLRRI